MILDNQSTVNCFPNRKYLWNIQQVTNHKVVKCNAGTQTRYPEPVWYDPGGIANAISLKRAEKYCIIDYHSEDGKGFVVTYQENELVLCFHESIEKRFILY